MISLINNNDKDLIRIESELTIEKSMNGTLIKTLSNVDKSGTSKLLVYLISRMNDSFSMNNRLNDNQILMLSVDLLEVFGYETIEDVVMIFKLARQGKLGGKLYRLDSQTIFQEWVPAYLDMKAEKRESIHKKQIGFDIMGKVDTEWTPEAKEQIRKLRTELISAANEMKTKRGYATGSHEESLRELVEISKNYSDEDLEKYIIMWGQKEKYADYVVVLKNEKTRRENEQ